MIWKTRLLALHLFKKLFTAFPHCLLSPLMALQSISIAICIPEQTYYPSKKLLALLAPHWTTKSQYCSQTCYSNNLADNTSKQQISLAGRTAEGCHNPAKLRMFLAIVIHRRVVVQIIYPRTQSCYNHSPKIGDPLAKNCHFLLATSSLSPNFWHNQGKNLLTCTKFT